MDVRPTSAGLALSTARDHALNRAFLFIKPHAVTDATKKFVRDQLVANDIEIATEGSLGAEEIDQKMLIDKHYYAIASKATLVKPDKLPVPEAKFKEFFKKDWQEVLKGGQALNALDALDVLQVDVPGLDKMWAQCKKDGTLLKLGGGFYCAKMEPPGKGSYYVFNGFFMAMRGKYVQPGASLYYFLVEWTVSDLSWSDFRQKIIGPTDPVNAPAESIRGGIYSKWKEFGLASEPNTADNAVHASASPLEALFERTNWLGISMRDDPYGKVLVEHDVTPEMIEAWRPDPQVTYGHGDKKKKGSLYDAVEDLDVDRCTTVLNDIALHGHTDGACPRNQAFIFIKPHAMTTKVKNVARQCFEDNSMTILQEGTIEASQIDEEMLVDNHYYAIASKATLQTPDQLPVPADKFQAKFGLPWADALSSGKAFNALDACKKLGMSAAELAEAWNKAKSAGKLVKFSGGFYCAQLDGKDGSVYVFNGFFMEMRNKFVKPGARIYYFVVDWDPMFLPWADFRGKVLGATDPTKAPDTSVRGMIYKDWQALGLTSEPNMGDNGVHGSASPIEALFERMNWLGTRIDKDPFGKLLVKGGVTQQQVDEWSKDPQIYYGIGITKGSLYDDLEDVDSDVCLEECLEIARTGHTPNVVHNTGLIFIKPHAITDKVKDLAREHLVANGITILKEGFIDGATIDKDMLIDKHYYAIASKATLLTPDKLPVPADKFQKQFGVDWTATLNSGKAVNAKQACEKMGLDAAGLGAKWLDAKKAGNLVKFGGGFYCAKIDDLYIFNGFFMEMRDKYVAAGAGIYYFLAEWDPLDLAWGDFRALVLGPTDPTQAPESSLRGKIFLNWKELGLTKEPNVGDNGVHASASPFEGLAERMNWLGIKAEEDAFALMLMQGGATKEDIEKWVLDPQVTFESHHKNVTKSLYDTLEDVDADRCVVLAELIIGKRAIAAPVPATIKAGDPTPGVFKVVFIRHGESDWNVKNIFTGWTDVDLSPAGCKEAEEAGKMLKDANFKFDIVFTSVLRRAIKTAWTALMGSENYAMPVIKSWRLNERHYGGLQGMNKAETAAKHGDAQVKIWRRSYDIPPPEIDASDARHPANDPLYKNVPTSALPGAESLKLTVDRVLPFWFDAIAPCIMAGRSVMVAAHGNSLRAICKYVEGMSEAEVLEFNIPTGVPLVYELDAQLQFKRKYYLMDPEEVAKKIAAVANQGKAK